jgi:hypothetical protein
MKLLWENILKGHRTLQGERKLKSSNRQDLEILYERIRRLHTRVANPRTKFDFWEKHKSIGRTHTKESVKEAQNLTCAGCEMCRKKNAVARAPAPKDKVNVKSKLGNALTPLQRFSDGRSPGLWSGRRHGLHVC